MTPSFMTTGSLALRSLSAAASLSHSLRRALAERLAGLPPRDGRESARRSVTAASATPSPTPQDSPA
ncbi:hypothetical protein NON00_00670 [Roseomonas sp. GC11]|uniref:hypothetical protein n=1 Tax=Roseomonas sp. GC11 TaxID=2950546 RepID=UPI00210957D9|nr:hypothetical protein [Roseomonas sp. GC11]MCQ4158440.1 hypothetical protein [Roseomonas sp. GC11]